MSICSCGNEAQEDSGLCDRCMALQILELPPSASPEEIKAAWHLLVKVWHPDRFQTDPKLKQAAEDKVKAINSAYRLLTSPPAGKSRPRRPERSPRSEAAPPTPPQAEAYPGSSPSVAAAAPGRFKLPSFWTSLAAMGVLQRVVILVCGVTAGGVALHFIDSKLASDPTTAAVYGTYRAQMADAMQAPKQRIWDIADGIARKFHPPKPLPAAMPAAEPPARPSAEPVSLPQPSARAQRKTSAPRAQLAPFITVGLTREEVIAIAGAPAADSGDKLAYNGAELDFKDGRLSGWKIDPATAPLRVKLWPETSVDPTLDVFSVGSTKDDVLLVQGTPTLLSADKFGYGSSEIYFRNNRVVSWKNDPASVPLRAVSR